MSIFEITKTMYINILQITNLILKKETSVEWNNDLSNINMSLYPTFSTLEKRLEILKSVSLSVKDLTFDSHLSSNDGGSFRYINPIIDLFINDTVFNNSRVNGGSGGAMYLYSPSKIGIFNNSFYNNSASGFGGTIYSESKEINIKDSKFYKSRSNSSGGTGLFNVIISNITSNWFEDSEATSSGGVMFLSTNSVSYYNIKDCFFGFCKASNGGALYLNPSALSYSNILESTFYYCISTSHGGAIYININLLTLNINKVCMSFCYINTTSSNGFQGTAIWISTSTSDYTIQLNYVSSYFCGKSGTSLGAIYIYNGQHFINGINLSHNIGFQSGCFYRPLYSSTYQYNTYYNCTSSNSNLIHYQCPSSFFQNILYNNIIENQAFANILHVELSSSNKFIIMYSVFLNNSIVGGVHFMLSANSIQSIKNCYIVHSGNIWINFSPESCITTSVLTSTLILTHYSTFLCRTPNELGQLENINCQTQPPNPTSCNFETVQQLSINSITNIFNLFLISLLNLIIF